MRIKLTKSGILKSLFVSACLPVAGFMSGYLAMPDHPPEKPVLQNYGESSQENWKVVLGHYRVTSNEGWPLQYIGAVHSFIDFYGPGEDLRYTVHGTTIDRTTGNLSRSLMDSLGQEPELALRGYAIPCTPEVIGKLPPHFSEILGQTFSRKTVVFEGSRCAVMQKYLIALDAMKVINEYNPVYDTVCVWDDPQNSNAMAGTLMRVLGLGRPDNLPWAPGWNNHLLPAGWKSVYTERDVSGYSPGYIDSLTRQACIDTLDFCGIARDTQGHPVRGGYIGTASASPAYQPLALRDTPEVLDRKLGRLFAVFNPVNANTPPSQNISSAAVLVLK